ncbi:uncharacterized protein LOC133777984 [Humulus lupulus]|uniref:uncharacterized protein LOC133777984 n=1 Tax=Humulus lupulus TaxID=3486 RepID=UPI002B404FDE|nr:uncharacterized protein LOC133777984 [Humulus lupulus]XP_062073767.1 uncharacterized protein LOC133777984 [Humulus lupulus]
MLAVQKGKMQQEENGDITPHQSLDKRPGIIFIGSPNAGKRTLVSRLTSIGFEDSSDSSSQELLGWTINTKYYTADVSICVAHLHDTFSISTLPSYSQLAALVMVFNMNDLSSLVSLQDWVSRNDLQKFEILLCIGNKVDLVPGHPVHSEYRRSLLKVNDLSADSQLEFDNYGISETEGSSLLGDDEPEMELEIRRSCLEWCTEHNIEFIEACASNADFDKCLSVYGDLQGVERLLGALSAHMWPGMIIKAGDKVTVAPFPEREDLSEEESDYELEYEVLSAGSAEPWDDTDKEWVSASDNPNLNGNLENVIKYDREAMRPSTSGAAMHDENDKASVIPHLEDPNQASKPDQSSHFEFEELEQLMSEISNIRDSLRLMPDFQRREMAAKMALKMATMFGGGSDDEQET